MSNSVTPWAAARQASLSFTISWCLLKLMSIESVMLSNHLTLCCHLILLPLVLFFAYSGPSQYQVQLYTPLQFLIISLSLPKAATFLRGLELQQVHCPISRECLALSRLNECLMSQKQKDNRFFHVVERALNKDLSHVGSHLPFTGGQQPTWASYFS